MAAFSGLFLFRNKMRSKSDEERDFVLPRGCVWHTSSNLTAIVLVWLQKIIPTNKEKRYETRIALCEKARDPDGARLCSAFAAAAGDAQVASPDFGSGKGLTLALFPARYGSKSAVAQPEVRSARSSV